jgi:hypothetical protein
MIPALIAAGASLVGSHMANEANRDIAEQANAFSAQQFANRYQTTVKDMQAAGLNPMLAYSQGGGSAPSGQVGAPQQNIAHSASEAYTQGSQREMMAEQIKNLKADNVIKGATYEKERNLAADAQASAILKGSQASEIQQRMEKEATSAEFWKSNANIQNLSNQRQVQLLTEQIDQVTQAIVTGKSSAAQLNAMAEQLKASTTNLKLDANEKAAMAELWKHLGEGGAAVKVMLPFLRLLKSILGK